MGCGTESSAHPPTRVSARSCGIGHASVGSRKTVPERTARDRATKPPNPPSTINLQCDNVRFDLHTTLGYIFRTRGAARAFVVRDQGRAVTILVPQPQHSSARCFTDFSLPSISALVDRLGYKAMRLPHLLRTPRGVFYFQMRVPKSFQNVLGTTVLHRSLGTRDANVARVRSYALSLRYAQAFAGNRGGAMSKPLQDSLLRDVCN
jgi:hypothetical protein